MYVNNYLYMIAGFAALLATPELCSTKDLPDAGGSIHNDYIGIVEGKRYYANNVNMNWADAETHCINSGMRLATAETETQIEFLKSNTPGNIVYWMAARERSDLSRFRWEYNLESPGNADLEDGYYPPVEFCIGLFTTWKLYRANPCSQELYSLCEIV